MKNLPILILAISFASNCNNLFAQDNNTLPNHGLTHKLTDSEKISMKNTYKDFLTTAPPAGPVRNIAEFETSEAVIIAYVNGFGLPYTVIKDLSNTGKVIIVSSTSQATLTNLLNTNNVNMANVSFLTSSLNSWWTRDYSGWFIADSSDHVQIVDFTYNRPRPLDDAVTGLEATMLGITMYGMDLVHTGGNYMCDGFNNAVSTVLVEEENTSLTTAQIQQKASDYLGINNYMIRPDAQGAYIEHIDCWAKLLAPDKMLVDSVPATDAQYSMYEAAAAYFASTASPYGYNYKVTRVLIAGSAETAAAEPYSNSFIFNNRVFVPIKGGSSAPHDTAALQRYRAAMPGYIVKGYTAASGAAWYGTDALHCRTHEIADRAMLYIEHLPLYGYLNSTVGYDVNAKVISYAGNPIISGYPKVIYKINSNGTWDSIAMTNVGGHNYSGTIPNQTSGDTVFYYIKAKDSTGKIAFHALMGKMDPHYFIIDGSIGIPELNVNTELSYFTYPNPSKGSFYLFLKSNYADKATIKIFNILGKEIYFDNFEFESGSNKKSINLNNVNSGVYFIEIKSKAGVFSKKLIIE
ncbi:MAG: agmatine deiminase family protein [Bacteroidetes bacterium]|nr:agmatine deiminase family protein [Bacteroidota bacterium]